MARLVNLMVRCGADFSSLTKATKKAQTSMSSLQRTSGLLKKSLGALGLTLSAAAVIGFGKACVDAASDLQEVQNVVDVTFGSMSKKIDDFARTSIQRFGLSEKAAKQYSGTMGAMLKSMGLSTEQAADMSMTITGLAGDMASFYNLNADDAFAKIRSGISGEVEPLRQLGINLSIANLEAFAMSKGITKAYNAMRPAEQAVLRYNYLISATADAQGDFSRTSNSWANQTRILAEQFNQLKVALGQGLIQALTPVITVINQVMAKLVELAQFFSAITAKLFGKQTAAASANADAVETAAQAQNNLAGGISNAGKAAEKEKKKLAGFDELNILQGNESQASTGGGGGVSSLGAGIPVADYTMPEVDTSSILNSLGPLEMVKNVVEQVVDLFLKIRDLITGEIDFGEFAGSLSPLQTVLAGIAAALAAIAIAAAGITVFNTIKDFFDSIKAMNAVGILGKIGEVIAIVASGAGDLHEAMQLVFGPGSILAGIGLLVGGAVTAILNFVNMLKNGFSWVNEWLMILGIALAAVGAIILGAPMLIAGVVAGIIALVATLVVMVVQYGDSIKDALNSVEVKFDGFFHFVEYLWEGIKDIFIGLIDFISGVFTGDWERALYGLYSIFEGVGELMAGLIAGIGDIFIGLLNGIIEGWNWLAGMLEGKSIQVPTEWGGGSFQVGKIDSIPYLANGAVIPPNSEFLAVLGDQSHGTNIEAPLDTIKQAVAEVVGGDRELMREQNQLLRQILAKSGTYLDGKEVASWLAPHQRDLERARGW